MKIAKSNSVKLLSGVLLLAILTLTSVRNADAQNTGTFTDPRDGETYTTIVIGNPHAGTEVTWMAQNLRYRTANSWAYDNQERYVQNLGRLYTWRAAMEACPAGWRLPSDADWEALINEFINADEDDVGRIVRKYPIVSTTAGTALKSTRGWNNDGNGSNISGFSALPGGILDNDGSFEKIGESGYWWSSTETPPSGFAPPFAWLFSLHYDISRFGPDTVIRTGYYIEYGVSVRCLRD